MKVYGLKSKLVLAVSALLTMLLGFVAVTGFLYFEAVFKETVFQQEFLLVENVAREIDNKLDIVHGALIGIGQQVTPAMVTDAEQAQSFLDGKKGMSSIFDNHIFLFSPEGKIIAETPFVAGRRGQEFSHREYIQTTLQTGRPHIGAPYTSSQPHRHPSVMFTVPIFDENNQLIAILAGGLDLLRDNFLGSLPTQKIGRNGYFYLFDTDRRILIHPEAGRILQKDVPVGMNFLFDQAIDGFNGTEETITTRGVTVLASFKHLEKTNWILGANHPVAEVYAPFLRAQRLFFLVVPLGGILLLLLLWYAMKRMLQPLEKLTDHVDTVSSKQGEQRFFRVESLDEVGALGLAFNRMLRELDAEAMRNSHYNRHLELLHEVSLELMGRRNLDELFAGILQRAGELIGTPHGFIFLLNRDEEVFAQHIGRGFFSEDVGRQVRLGVGLVSRVWETGEIQTVGKYSQWSEALDTVLTPRLGAMLQAPLKSDGQVVGTVGLAYIDSDKTFGEEEIRITRQFSEMASIAYDNVRFYTLAQQELEKRQRAQDALRLVNDDLEHKVEERTLELMAMNEELIAMNSEHMTINRELKEAIEQLHAMQDQLIRSETMASLGGLVAGVAHEINTPVGVSLTAASHLKKVTEEFELLCRDGSVMRKDLLEYLQDLREAADIIFKNLERSARLIRSFKQVSVDQTSENFRTFSIKSYVEEILLSVQPLLRKTQLTVDVICDDALTMHGLPGIFAQIITNLIMNSLQHAYDPDAEGIIRISARREDHLLELRYRDDGRGMDENARRKIFDPFFTTRRGSGGTGLGMYIVYNIVTQQFGGSIECTSELGGGTEFIIRFPAMLESKR